MYETWNIKLKNANQKPIVGYGTIHKAPLCRRRFLILAGFWIGHVESIVVA